MNYKALKQNLYSNGEFSLIPIRSQDRYDIMNWRNEQIHLLRQKKPLTKEEQDNYFDNIIAKLFEEEKPGQILFSYLKDYICIGYGGLVHINWENKNAEISFLLDDKLNNQGFYNSSFKVFLKLIIELAKSLNLKKVFTYGYSVEEYRFTPLIELGFDNEAVHKDHILISNRYHDVLIYSYILDK